MYTHHKLYFFRVMETETIIENERLEFYTFVEKMELIKVNPSYIKNYHDNYSRVVGLL